MPYVINKWDGTPLVNIADRTVDTTATSIRLPGRNYPSYGELVVEDLVWMLENFASVNAPPNPMTGQLWYNTQISTLYAWNGSTWLSTGGVIYSATEPLVVPQGQLWYHSGKRQLFVKDTILGWKLIGPMGSEDNSNPNVSLTALPSYSTIEAVNLNNNALPAVPQPVIRLVVEGTVVAILSKNPSFIPTPVIAGFTQINPGLNLNTTIPSINISGIPTLPVATNTTQPATTEFVHNVLPYGSIIMWYGAIAAIPTGWTLCDGTKGTPDLRSRFVFGAGTVNPGSSGGSTNLALSGTVNGTTNAHTLTEAEIPAHTHAGTTDTAGAHAHQQGSESLYNDYGGGNFVGQRGWGPDFFPVDAYRNQSTSTAGSHSHPFITQTTGGNLGHTHGFSAAVNLNGAVMPPYVALAYIMKII